MIKNLDNSTSQNYSDTYDSIDVMDEEFGVEEGMEFESKSPRVVDADSVYREIDELTTLAKSQGASPELLQQLAQKKKLALQSAALSPEKRSEVLLEIQANLDGLHQDIQTEVEQAPGREALQKEIQELRGELQAEVLGDDAEKDIASKCSEAETALKDKDLESAQGLVQEAKDELQYSKDEAKALKDEKTGERKTAVEDMQNMLKVSDLSEEKKEELSKKIDTLKSGWESGDVDDEKAAEELKALKGEISKEVKIAALKSSFVGFSAKIPSFADTNLTADLAGRITKAINSDNWDSVLSLLKDPNVDKDNIYHAVRQMVGTMYYGLAGEDEKKLEQLLDLIPKEVRQAMYNCIMPQFKDNNHWSGNEKDRKDHYLYGSTGGTVAARLEESWQKDDIGADMDNVGA